MTLCIDKDGNDKTGGSSCSQAHSTYKWLEKDYGVLRNVMFEEPPGSGKWRPYDDHIWDIHCDVVDHNPKNLVQAHYDAFIGPNRFANLKFTFTNGRVMAPTVRFYELERDYFLKQHS